MKSLEEIQAEIGKETYQEWRKDARADYDGRDTHELTRSVYINMSVRWRYAKMKESEAALKRAAGEVH